MDMDTTPSSSRPQPGSSPVCLSVGRVCVPGSTPEASLHHSSHTVTITDPLRWSISGFRNPTHLVCFTLSLAGALGIHPEVGVHVVGADARMGVSDVWQR